MSALNFGSLFGAIMLCGIAWAVGKFPRPVPWRTVLTSGGLMLFFGICVFWLPPTRILFLWLNGIVLTILSSANAGAEFLFGPLALNPGMKTSSGDPSVGFVFAAQALPAVIFFASIMALLYYLRILQPVVRFFARIFHRTMKLSGAEALSGSSNIFIGVEAATTIRPFLSKMTKSELLTVLTCGMSTVASTTLAIYVMFLREEFPAIAGHLISASVMSIPAAVIMSKLILPERETPKTLGEVPPIEESDRGSSVMGALSHGSWDGLKLAAGIATLLIAVLGVVALVNVILGWISDPFSHAIGVLSLERILSWIFTPVAFLLGIQGSDLVEAGRLLGQRIIVTEVISYHELGKLAVAGSISPRTIVVLSYALCGFAHFASMGIFVGGIGALAPSRRNDLAGLGLRALIGATLATLMTGAVAGLLYHGKTGLLF